MVAVQNIMKPSPLARYAKLRALRTPSTARLK
jgi:hypothetical protein